jgi:uncharacterized protein HemX
LILVSCSSTPRNYEGIGTQIKDIDKFIASVNGSSSSIDNHADQIISSVKGSTEENEVLPHAIAIKEESSSLREISTELKTVQSSLSQSEKDMIAQQKKNEQLQKQVVELKSENKKLISKMLAWLAASSVAGIGICVLLVFLTQNKLAVYGAIACGITMCVAIAASTLLSYIIYGTAIVFVLLVGIVGYYCFKNVKQKKTAITEVVQTAEAAKEHLTDEIKNKVFGDNGLANSIQSDSTKSIVQRIRSFIKENK